MDGCSGGNACSRREGGLRTGSVALVPGNMEHQVGRKRQDSGFKSRVKGRPQGPACHCPRRAHTKPKTPDQWSHRLRKIVIRLYVTPFTLLLLEAKQMDGHGSDGIACCRGPWSTKVQDPVASGVTCRVAEEKLSSPRPCGPALGWCGRSEGSCIFAGRPPCWHPVAEAKPWENPGRTAPGPTRCFAGGYCIVEMRETLWCLGFGPPSAPKSLESRPVWHQNTMKKGSKWGPPFWSFFPDHLECRNKHLCPFRACGYLSPPYKRKL